MRNKTWLKAEGKIQVAKAAQTKTCHPSRLRDEEIFQLFAAQAKLPLLLYYLHRSLGFAMCLESLTEGPIVFLGLWKLSRAA